MTALVPGSEEPSINAKIIAYDDMRAAAEALGYPSILEALEATPPATTECASNPGQLNAGEAGELVERLKSLRRYDKLFTAEHDDVQQAAALISSLLEGQRKDREALDRIDALNPKLMPDDPGFFLRQAQGIARDRLSPRQQEEVGT